MANEFIDHALGETNPLDSSESERLRRSTLAPGLGVSRALLVCLSDLIATASVSAGRITQHTQTVSVLGSRWAHRFGTRFRLPLDRTIRREGPLRALLALLAWCLAVSPVIAAEPGVRPGRRPDSFPHRIWAACDFEARAPDYAWFGMEETNRIPLYPGNRTSLRAAAGPYQSVSAVMAGINPVPGPRMGRENGMFLRYFLQGGTQNSAFPAGNLVDDLFFFVEGAAAKDATLFVDEVVLFDAGTLDP